MTGFYITIGVFVLFVLWMIWEYKHAPLMPDDFDPRTRDEKLMDEERKIQITNNNIQLTKTQPAK